MAKAKKNEELFGRTDAKTEAKTSAALRKRLTATQSVCLSRDFRAWLFDTLDDLSGFSRDEGMLTDFGQGIRAAAARIKNRLLIVPEGIEVLTELTRRNLEAEHEGIVAAMKDE